MVSSHIRYQEVPLSEQSRVDETKGPFQAFIDSGAPWESETFSLFCNNRDPEYVAYPMDP